MICGVCSTEPCRCPSSTDRHILAAALVELRRQHARVQAASERAAAKRRDLPAGTSRARVTTANSKWARAAEERDRLGNLIKECERRLRGRRTPNPKDEP